MGSLKSSELEMGGGNSKEKVIVKVKEKTKEE